MPPGRFVGLRQGSEEQQGALLMLLCSWPVITITWGAKKNIYVGAHPGMI